MQYINVAYVDLRIYFIIEIFAITTLLNIIIF